MGAASCVSGHDSLSRDSYQLSIFNYQLDFNAPLHRHNLTHGVIAMGRQLPQRQAAIVLLRRLGRSKHIFITTAGKQFREQAIAAMSNDLGRLAERLDTHAMLDAIPMLAKVRSVLDEDRN